MISVLHNVMWSIGKMSLIRPRGNLVYLFEPLWAKMGLKRHIEKLFYTFSILYILKIKANTTGASLYLAPCFVFMLLSHLSLVKRNSVFGVCDQVRLKPACSATETS